jgi:hypothetical protein
MSKRSMGMCTLVVALAAASVGTATAAFPDSDVDTYTGCLNAGGSSGGTLNQLDVGLSPLKPCGANQKLVHLGGGDITEVKPGAGLTGGGANGSVTLGLDAGHSLPQSCDPGASPKADSTSGWVCGVDNDHQYYAGDGLYQSGNGFYLRSNYQLPQGCNYGDVPEQRNGVWVCADRKPTLVHRVIGYANVSQSGWTQVARMELNYGFYLFTVTGVAQDDSDGNNEVSIECKLYQGDTDWSDTWVDIGDQGSEFGPAAPITMTHVIGDPSKGTVASLYCTSHVGTDHLTNVDLTALPLGGLTNG